MSNAGKTPMKFELYSAEDRDKYLVHSTSEIAHILTALKRSRAMVTAHFNQGADFLLTTILAVDADNGYFWMDYGGSRTVNERALRADSLFFTANQGQVKIQFSAGPLVASEFEDGRAFACPLPEEVLRLQRRDYYRIATPMMNAVRCFIPVAGPKPAEVGVADISCGGISVIDTKRLLDVEPGRVYERCRLELPGEAPLTVSLQIRNAFEVTLRNGHKHRRCGCEFVGIPEKTRAAIQRYITRLERERRARSTDE